MAISVYLCSICSSIVFLCVVPKAGGTFTFLIVENVIKREEDTIVSDKILIKQ